MQPNQNSQSLVLPIAIIIGFAIIAVTIFVSSSGASSTQSASQEVMNTTPTDQELATRLHEPIATVTRNDNVRGNPNAPIMFVTYTSYDCPSCRNFHIAMNRILQEFGRDGIVSWAFRHLPLEENHPNANRIANAAECVAELGGNQAFWDFSDQVFTERGSVEPTQISRLSRYATEAGVNVTEFNTCVDREQYIDRVTAQADDALSSGALGVPYTVIMAGEHIGVINGPLPYIEIRDIIQEILAGAEEEN